MGNYKVLNIQHIYINNEPYTTAEMFLDNGDAWVFDGIAAVKGHYKKESTVIRKYLAQE